jgi:iron-sulfur cluster repair protein YtfE (RIC family)
MDKSEEARQMALVSLATPPPASQLLTPLDFIFAEHFRQRSLCWLIDQVADAAETDKDSVAAALRFLRSDFGLHVIDEEEDLFPLLRRRAEPEDRIADVLGELSEEHAADKQDAEEIVDRFSDAAETERKRRLTRAFRKLLHRFAANERRHLIVENAIVLPLARVRLEIDDLHNLGRRMAARRGIDYSDIAHAV